jgi:DNA-binding SARP family transcriptional activator
LEVRAGDGPLPLGGAKQRALLAMLLLNANRVVARERLIDTLWGEAPETAVKLVQLYLSQLRKLLPAGVIATRAPGYVLEVDLESVDLLRFERLLAEARSAQAAQAAELLREALELWRGPALAEFGEESFFRHESARLEELRLAALEQRIEAELALGLHAELAAELESLIGLWPHRERLRGQLMLALYRSGRQADALAAYRDAREVLDELGLEPGDELRGLERRILTRIRSFASVQTEIGPPQPGCM